MFLSEVNKQKNTAAIGLSVFLTVALLLTASLSAQDKIVLKSGKTITGAVLGYRDGNIRIRIDSGEIQKNSIEEIENIKLQESNLPEQALWREPGEKPTETEALEPAEVVANAGELEGKPVEISGIINKSEQRGINADTFNIVLHGGLKVQIDQEHFANRYLAINNLSRSLSYPSASDWYLHKIAKHLELDEIPPPQIYYSPHYYEIGFYGKGFDVEIYLLKRYSDLKGNQKTTLDRTKIQLSHRKIKARGQVETRGNDVFLKRAYLISIE